MITGRKCTEPGLWDEVIHDFSGHPLQLWGWGELKSAHNWQAERVLFIDDEDGVIGAAQILVKSLPFPFKRISYVSRGPVWLKGRGDEVLTALQLYTKEVFPGTLLRVEPDKEDISFPEGWQKSTSTILSPQTLILDLNRDEDELLASMSQKTFQYIQELNDSDLNIKQVTRPQDIAECLALYQQTAQHAGFNIHDDQYYHDVSTMMGDYSVIYAAYEADKPVAFLWLAISSATAFELYSGINERGQELQANYMIKWHAITKCKSWGIERYDLNGLSDDADSTFKRGFADHENTLVGTYDYPLSPLYSLWTNGLPTIKKALHLIRK